MTRILMAGVIALSAIAAAPAAADAKTKRAKSAKAQYPYARPYVDPRRADTSDSAECIRARSQDPGGTYRNYPCWARAALSPPERR